MRLIKSIPSGKRWAFFGILPCHAEVEVVFCTAKNQLQLKIKHFSFYAKYVASKKYLHISASTKPFHSIIISNVDLAKWRTEVEYYVQPCFCKYFCCLQGY